MIFTVLSYHASGKRLALYFPGNNKIKMARINAWILNPSNITRRKAWFILNQSILNYQKVEFSALISRLQPEMCNERRTISSFNSKQMKELLFMEKELFLWGSPFFQEGSPLPYLPEQTAKSQLRDKVGIKQAPGRLSDTKASPINSVCLTHCIPYLQTSRWRWIRGGR